MTLHACSSLQNLLPIAYSSLRPTLRLTAQFLRQHLLDLIFIFLFDHRHLMRAVQQIRIGLAAHHAALVYQDSVQKVKLVGSSATHLGISTRTGQGCPCVPTLR